MAFSKTVQFPPQKLSRGAKTEEWAKQCIDAAEDLAVFRNNGIRESYVNKLTNYNLANDILDVKDLEKVVNPMGIQNANFPAKMQNYPIANPKIDLLIGEERKRRFEWQVRVLNDDAISEKEDTKKEELFQFIASKIQSEVLNKEELDKELKELEKYYTYEYQDLRERMCSHILRYLFKHLNLKDEFSRGFEDALIAGEEIYCAEIVGGEPILRKVNPLNLHTVRSGESPWIEDSDIIVEDCYMSPGQIIDTFYDYLKPKHVEQIDQQLTEDGGRGFINIGERETSIVIDGIIDLENERLYGEYYDTEGNIRVVRALWKSYKKIGKLTYYDEDGMPQETIVSEKYKPDASLGEEVKWMWISEWWEGTKIGKDIYIKIQPKPVQFRSMTNLSKCHPGYTGIAYNINSSKAKSLMDRMKPYQYLYNVFMYRTELAFAKAKGKIATMDLASVPDGWEPDKWMYYAEIMGWAVKDSFKEAKKGMAQGKLAGQMQQNSPVLDLELGNYIQQHIMMLQFIENQLGEIAGVTKQRQGQIENRELVGNVERAVSQSSHITEKWFSLHNSVKAKAMALLLDTGKFAWRDAKDKRVQYVMDDLGTTMLNIDGETFRESEYGVIVSDGANDMELLSSLKQLAQAGLQNDKLNFSNLMDIYMTPSIGDIRRKLEKFEQDKEALAQQQLQQQQQMQQEQLQAQAEAAQAQRDFDMAKLDKEYGYKMEIEAMKLNNKFDEKMMDRDRDGIPDFMELERINAESRFKEKELSEKMKLEKEKLSHEARENAKDRDNKIQVQKISASKKPASK